jgi:hypothetical protein
MTLIPPCGYATGVRSINLEDSHKGEKNELKQKECEMGRNIEML